MTETPIPTDKNINKSAANAAGKPTGPEEGGSASGIRGDGGGMGKKLG